MIGLSLSVNLCKPCSSSLFRQRNNPLSWNSVRLRKAGQYDSRSIGCSPVSSLSALTHGVTNGPPITADAAAGGAWKFEHAGGYCFDLCSSCVRLVAIEKCSVVDLNSLCCRCVLDLCSILSICCIHVPLELVVD